MNYLTRSLATVTALSLCLSACVDAGETEIDVAESQSALKGQLLQAGDPDPAVTVIYHRATDVTLKRGVIDSPPADDDPDGLTTGEDGPLPPAAGDLVDVDDAPFQFELTAVAPRKAFAGHLSFHYPRDVETAVGDGSATFSTHRLYASDGYAEYHLKLDPTKTYAIRVCTHRQSGDATTAVHEINGYEISYDVPVSEGCQIEVGLDPHESTWVTGKVGFAPGETENTFTFDRVEIVATPK